MLPVDFPQKTNTLTKPKDMTDAECKPLSVYKDGTEIISCWRPTWRERFSILFFGRVWLHVLTTKTHAPVFLEGKKNIFPEG
jgi:hypothetical protein